MVLRGCRALARTCWLDNGSIYVHLDWHVGHYAKVVLDEVFGEDNFKNEIVWHYPGREMPSPIIQAKHDTIIFFAKYGSNED